MIWGRTLTTNATATTKVYDASGLLYYKTKSAGGNGFASGGLTQDDLVSSGVNSLVWPCYYSNRSIFLAGSGAFPIYDLSLPSLSATSNTAGSISLVVLTQSQISSSVSLTYNGFSPIKNKGISLYWFLAGGSVLLAILGLVYWYIKSKDSPDVYHRTEKFTDDLNSMTGTIQDRDVEPA